MRIIPADDYKIERNVDYGTPEQNAAVQKIIQDVAAEGDEALLRYTAAFDKMTLTASELRVTEEEVKAAYREVDEEFITAIRLAAHNIRSFHEKQKRTSWIDTQADGTILGQIMRPIKRVGLYVPGGTAAYPSSVLMNVIPAKVAGVSEIVMVTPPATAGQAGINPSILVAAAEAGVTEIYRVGGAQAIAALAYGTETIPAVDKICGPGNIYVALAKRYVYGSVDIDSIAGPTDIVVLADETADPEYVAADLLSQAEHDVMSSAILVTDSPRLAEAVAAEVDRQLAELPRREIAAAAIAKSAILTVESLDEGVRTVNRIAPEHLEVLVREPISVLPHIENAGAIFLGPYSTEPVGDYFAGPNHVLPTNGTARFSSPLNIDDFMKKSSIIQYSKAALMRDAEHIMKLARAEGFEGHARAVEIRVKKEGKSQ
jgi:histidinol dehydrogenase